nr:translesion error-prone DNA polymerase V autoproteolytic subunit [Arthrobacter livingstonensis]
MAAETDPRGFPSPARDYFHGGIDLNRHLIRDRTSTFVMRVSGNSMAGTGIADGDEIIVDRSLPPRDGCVVVAVVDGELLVRRFLRHNDGQPALSTEPSPPAAGQLAKPSELTVWGVVTRCLHHV